MTARLQNGNAVSKTIHGVGFAAIQRFWKNTGVDNVKRPRELTEIVCGVQAPDDIKILVTKLHTKAREIAPMATDVETIIDLAEEYDCVPDEEWENYGFGLRYACESTLKIMEAAANTKPRTGIDFADMLFLPLRNRWLRPIYDLVVIDEAQDQTLAMLDIAQGVCGGRIVVVGDDRQSIYGFRGADTGSLDRLKTQLQAKEYGLRTTYRCGHAIVAQAQRLVPDYLAHESNTPGAVFHRDKLEDLYVHARPGDFILSRRNAPLVSIAMKLLRENRRVKISGKDVGAGLIALANKLAKGKARHSIPQFLERLKHWQERETTRLEAAGKDDRVDAVKDKAEMLRYLTEGITGVPELTAKVAGLFEDKPSAEPHIVCSSIHKAKGLEADNVFILGSTLYPRLACQCGHRHPFRGSCKCGCTTYAPKESDRIQEANCEYVAITRARHQLTYINEKV